MTYLIVLNIAYMLVFLHAFKTISSHVRNQLKMKLICYKIFPFNKLIV